MINSIKIQKDFEKHGFIIVSVDKNKLEKIRSLIKKTICKKINYKPTNDFLNNNYFFNNFHKLVNKKKLNEVRFSVYHMITKNRDTCNLYYELAKPYLDEIIGNELAMQKKINLSIQIPNDKDSLLDMHSDIYAGESPFQTVVWVPLVDVYDTKAMFFTSPKVNKKLNDEVLNKNKNTVKQIYKINKKKFWHLKANYGQIIIFSPLILHGNTVNVTKETRFSLNCRFKSLLSPYDVLVKSHRNIPNFYRPLNVKPMTKIGFNYLKKYSVE